MFTRGIVERRAVSLEIGKSFGPGSDVARDVPGENNESMHSEALQIPLTGLHFPALLHAEPGNTSSPARRRDTSHGCIS